MPQVPYGWQKRGEKAIEIPSQRSSNITVFGLLTRDNYFKGYSHEGSFTSKDVIDALDDFVQSTTKKTVIVMDNAPIHRSHAFKERMKQWEEEDVHIWFLPPYSPHLNCIEILWQRMKYQWLEPRDYTNWNSLWNAIQTLLLGIGTLLKITFTYESGIRTMDSYNSVVY